MLRRLLFTLSLVLLFGLGQQGAAAHAVSHLADWQGQQQDKSSHNQTCDKCVVYAQLGGAMPSAGHVLPPADGQHVTAAARQYTLDSLTPLPYSARAPPTHS